MARKGREFELLIKRLETILFPKNAIINSPDFIFDKITKQKREVDISIRLELGTVSILIILECRDRNIVEDITWIEQLHSKTHALNANMVIAVSNSGFSRNAILKAKHYGIETRTYNELSIEDISEWFAVEEAVINTQNYILRNVEIDLGDIPILELESFSQNIESENFVTEIKNGNKINPKSIFLLAIEEYKIWNTIPVDNTFYTKLITVNLNFPEYRFKIVTDEKEYFIESIKYTADFQIETKNIPISKITSYNNENGSLAHTIEFENAFPDKNSVLQFTKTKDNHLFFSTRNKGNE